MRTHSTIARVFAALLLAGAVVAGCDSGGGDAGVKLRLELYGPPPGGTYADPFENVAFLRVSAEGDEFAPVETYVDFAAGKGQLAAVPFSTGIQLTVDALDLACVPRPGADPSLCAAAGACDSADAPCDWAPGNVLARGKTGFFDVASGVDARAVAVYMMRTNSYGPTVSASRSAPTQMVTPRIGHSATRLEDGRVLIVGGAEMSGDVTDHTATAALGTIYRSAEIYDPASGELSSVSSSDESTSLFSARAFHQAVLLPVANGPDRVAIFGGYSKVNDVLQPLASVEIFDPATGTFSNAGVPPMGTARAYHTATLKDGAGRVLLVGGRDDAASASWEVWDPSQGPITNGNLLVPRWNHTATFIPGTHDLVYLMGGENNDGVTSAAEIYNAVEDTLYSGYFEMGGSQARTLHTATFVSSQGFIYVIGGFADREKTQPLGRIDVFQVSCSPPAGETLAACWRSDVSFGLDVPRGGHTSSPLGGEAILINGGCVNEASSECGVGASEIIFRYDRVTEGPDGQQVVEPVVDIGDTGAPLAPRYGHHAVVLESGRALIVGGVRKSAGAYTMQAQPELFNPQ